MQDTRRLVTGSTGAKVGDVLIGVLLIVLLALWISLAYHPLPLV